MDDTYTQLEAQYCPPIDPALLSAILGDHDLRNEYGLNAAKATLDALKDSALLEEAAGFDASGTGGHEEHALLEQRAESSPETSASRSRETDVTTVSNGLSSFGFEEGASDKDIPVQSGEDLDKLDQETKTRLLQEVFGDRVSRYNIEHTLKKCNGRWTTAMEELLNHVYFSERHNEQGDMIVNAKGIDAFADENINRRGRKGKTKNKRSKGIEDRRSSSLSALYNGSTTPTSNKWNTATEEISFVSSRINLASTTVSAVYYENGASVSRTIAALLKISKDETTQNVSDATVIQSHAKELGSDFPTIAQDYLIALVRLTHPSTAAAHELAKALTTKSTDPSPGGIQIIPRYVPANLDDAHSSWSTVAAKAKSAVSSRSPSQDTVAAAVRRDEYAQARAVAFAQANAAHRKAKSNHLMGGAAAYYGQVGREYAALSSLASSAAADELAAAQSTSTQLDLHGIDVANGVRIAQERVEEWWKGLGERRVNGRVGAEDRQTGYRIVVGLGRHSEGGKGKLGPAVLKVLRQEGWRVELEGAVILVKGPARR